MSVISPIIDKDAIEAIITASVVCFKREDYQLVKQYLPKGTYKIVLDTLVQKLGKESGINKSKVANIISGICEDNWGVWGVIHDLALVGMAEKIATLEKASRAEHQAAQMQIMQALAEGKTITIDGKPVPAKAMTAMVSIYRVVPT